MRRITALVSGLLGLLLVAACSTAVDDVTDARLASQAVTAGPVDLIAGQNTDVGDVSFDRDGTLLTVTFTVAEGWCLTETHLQVASTPEGLPQSPGGLVPGQFDGNREHACEGETSYTVDLSDFGFVGGTDFGSVVIAAHAVVAGTGENADVTETAWGEGITVGNNWSMYLEYGVEGCAVGATQIVDDPSVQAITDIVVVDRGDVVDTWPPESDTTAYLIREGDDTYTLQLDPTGSSQSNTVGLVASIEFCRDIVAFDPGSSPNGLEDSAIHPSYYDDQYAGLGTRFLTVDFRANSAADRLGVTLESVVP